jgi:hypothetical protein
VPSRAVFVSRVLPGTTTATGDVDDDDDDSAPVAGGGGFLRKVGGAFLAVVSVPLRTAPDV